MLDAAHRRLDQIERKLAMLEMNPAPTVPQYDLIGPTHWWTFFSSGFDYTVELAGPGNYTVEVHYDVPNLLCTGYLNGIQVKQFNIDPTFGFLSMGSVEMGWLFAYELGYRTEFDNVSDPGMHYEIRNLKVGTSRHGTDIWNDNLSTTPTIPPYWYSSFINAAHINPVTIAGETWLSMDYIDTGNTFVTFKNDMGSHTNLWWQYDVHISDEFFIWLRGQMTGPNNAYIGELFTNPTSGDRSDTDPPVRIGVWYG